VNNLPKVKVERPGVEPATFVSRANSLTITPAGPLTQVHSCRMFCAKVPTVLHRRVSARQSDYVSFVEVQLRRVLRFMMSYRLHARSILQPHIIVDSNCYYYNTRLTASFPGQPGYKPV